ncbi:MAG: class I SAM-dependent methyltransferase, partial [Armatimonadetes bacterium]|nr:class I SAM-dependent methyltransferase [Armatimonadota bacterium]
VARERGITVHECTLQDAAFSPGSFDLITLWDVAEHLQQPRETFARLAEWLRPGGYIALETGNVGCRWARAMGADWWYVTLLEHCSFYTVDSLRRIFENAGLDLVHWEPTAHHRVSPVKTLIQMGKSGIYRAASRADERRWPLLKHIGPRLLQRHPPCAMVKDHLFVIAQGVL